jgi:hypothetical protein
MVRSSWLEEDVVRLERWTGWLSCALLGVLVCMAALLSGCGAGGGTTGLGGGATDDVAAAALAGPVGSREEAGVGVGSAAPNAGGSTPVAIESSPSVGTPAASDSSASTAASTAGAGASSGAPAASPAPPLALQVPARASLAHPAVGTHELAVLSSSVLDLTYINSEAPGGSPTVWSFLVDGSPSLPSAASFHVTVDGSPVAVRAVGFKRRPLYAPDRNRDLRIRNDLFLELGGAASSGTVVVTCDDPRVSPGGETWTATVDPLGLSPAIHVNQEGYMAGMPKKAFVGAFLGSLGELTLPSQSFQLVDDVGRVAFQGTLALRVEQGSTSYQKVYQADFSSFTTPGRYRLAVPGLGASYPFYVDDAVAADFARTYALGLYHKRCGADNALPFTRFVHRACHLASVQIPTMDAVFSNVNKQLSSMTAALDPWQIAPVLGKVAASLYPFVKSGSVDAHGGYHDAGDYSKYSIDDAQLIHHLTFAVDNLPGVAALDNLGLPESGDGKSDFLELAKWEADYLCRIQDGDGGFSFLCYPRDVAYEWDVLPDNDKYAPQVLYPKNTSATACAVAALAQLATSPTFKRQFPDEAASYLAHATSGWRFLQNAWSLYGRQGAYQKITHYGLEFSDRDEIVWAEVEMYLATGDPAIHRQLLADFNPNDPAIVHWSWWRLFESYGCAIRDYAFGARSGRVAASALDPTLLAACENQIAMAAQDQLGYASASAYNVSYPAADKRWGNAAWLLPSERAFDMVVGYQLQPSPALLDAIVGNVNYEQGGNPVNVSFVTGLGWQRPLEIVDQYSKNDRRVLPVSGIGVGALSAGLPSLSPYGGELSRLTWPADGMYDRYTDTWDVSREIVSSLQARALCTTAWLMAQTAEAGQAWRCAPATLSLSSAATVGVPVTATLSVPGLDPSTAARIVWEGAGVAPTFGGTSFTYVAPYAGAGWIEAEVQWPDGRRAFAVADFAVASGDGATASGGVPVSFRFALNGPVTRVGNGYVNLTCYGVDCRIPYGQATFNAGGGPLPYDAIQVGTRVSCTVAPFDAVLVSASAAAIGLASPLGTLVVPAQTLSDATQQQLQVLVKKSGATFPATLYDALALYGPGGIVGVAP